MRPKFTLSFVDTVFLEHFDKCEISGSLRPGALLWNFNDRGLFGFPSRYCFPINRRFKKRRLAEKSLTLTSITDMDTVHVVLLVFNAVSRRNEKKTRDFMKISGQVPMHRLKANSPCASRHGNAAVSLICP
jgi:hypothetical protein